MICMYVLHYISTGIEYLFNIDLTSYDVELIIAKLYMIDS